MEGCNMRIKLASIIIVLFTYSSLAQTEFYEGFYVSRDFDTVYGKFCVPGTGVGELPNLAYMQNRVMYQDEDEIRQDITPTKALEVVFVAHKTKFRLIAVKNTLGLDTDIMNKSSYLFIRIVQDGQVKLYQYFYRKNASKHQSLSSSIYFTDANNKDYRYCIRMGKKGDLIRVRKYRFRKIMSEIFADYEELVEAIKNKDYRKEDIEIIVNDYNKWHDGYYNEK